MINLPESTFTSNDQTMRAAHIMLIGLILSFLLVPSYGRLKYRWTYEELAEKSDLIVIATPISVKKRGKSVFPGARMTEEDGSSKPIPAIKTRVKFEVLAVLKGTHEGETLVFNYLRPVPINKLILSGPLVPYFGTHEKRRFLMFLKRDSKEGYTTVSSLVDSLDSVKDLGLWP